MSECIDIAPRSVRFFRVVIGEWEYTYEIPPEADYIRVVIDVEDNNLIVKEIKFGGVDKTIPWKSRFPAGYWEKRS